MHHEIVTQHKHLSIHCGKWTKRACHVSGYFLMRLQLAFKPGAVVIASSCTAVAVVQIIQGKVFKEGSIFAGELRRGIMVPGSSEATNSNCGAIEEA